MEPLRCYLGTGELAVRVEDDPDGAERSVFVDFTGEDYACAAKLTAREAAEVSAWLALAAATVTSGRPA